MYPFTQATCSIKIHWAGKRVMKYIWVNGKYKLTPGYDKLVGNETV